MRMLEKLPTFKPQDNVGVTSKQHDRQSPLNCLHFIFAQYLVHKNQKLLAEICSKTLAFNDNTLVQE